MTDNSDTNKKNLLEALEKSLGVVTTACKNAGLHRSTYYDYYNNDEEFQSKVEDIQNIAIDFAESQLHKQILDGNSTSTIFFLKTKGKKRGYIERSEIAHEVSSSQFNFIVEGEEPEES